MKLRGAISGFGQVAALGHLPGWRTRPDVEIVAVHEPLAERRHEALKLIRNVRVYEDLELMLNGEHLDFLDIASPPAYHPAAARLALEAGVHVLIEKPLCLSLEEFDRLAALAASRNRTLFCVHNWKHAPAYRLAGELVAQDRLGALRYVSLIRLRTEQARGVSEVSTHGSSASHPSTTPWRLSAASGGGILIDHGWHIFYLMHWLMGHRAPETISARLGVDRESGIDEVADLGIGFGDGRIGYVHLSWRAPVRRTSAMLYGSKAILEIEGDHVILTSQSGKREDLSVADAPDDSYHSAWFGNLAAEFESVLTGANPRAAASNIIEARTALVLILAARQSNDSDGSSIDLSS
ncbi:MAG: Gfo/Idh/MocA family oxidoreductase [Candidatus Binataceae bacterium]|jgi:predicted dehydrogenase